MSQKVPSQTEFNEFHKTPIDYGEDGECAVGSNYTQAEAFELFRQYWLDNDGSEPDHIKIEDVVLQDFGWSIHPDYRNDEDNMAYVLLNGSSESKPLFTGWVLSV